MMNRLEFGLLIVKNISKIIEQKIRAMNKRNLDLVMEQMRQRRKKKTGMTDAEYAMNRETLQKAKETLSKK